MTPAEKITIAAENIPKVYKEGQKTEYDKIWDAFQDYGNRKNYDGLFAATQRDPRTWFKPKYDLKPTSLYMFTWMASSILNQIDFVEWFEELGIKFDTSECTQFQYAFNKGKRYGVIDASSATSLANQVFYVNSALETIDELIIHKDIGFGTMTFQNCSSLVNLKISGTIGKTGFDVHWSTKLSKDSIESIINALSSETTGLTVTLSQKAVQTAFGSEESADWQALIATKSNWTISLA